MKKILLPILALILSACAAQMTITPFAEVTVTSPPSTATAIPTPTLHPQYVTLQEKIANASDKFTLNSSNGLIEFQSETGVVAVNGIKINPDGSGTLITGEGEVGFDPNGLVFDTNSVTLVDVNGQSWVWSKEKGLVPAEVEIKQFPVCGIENFRDCPVTLEDIFNGNVDRWLETQKKPFDTDKIKNVPLIWYEGWDLIQYDVHFKDRTKFLANFNEPGTEQQHRDIAMYLPYEVDGVVYDYVFLPVEVYNPATGESHWVKTVFPIYQQGNNSPKTVQDWAQKHWKDMNITPILTSPIIPLTNIIDPLSALTFQIHADDISTRLANFASGVDMSALSESDIILQNYIAIGNEEFK